jgi:hypothetical protein
MANKKKDLVVVNEQLPQPQLNSAESLISQAINQNVSIETMEKLLTMRRELKAEWAKEQFDRAMSDFQGECPVIAKSKAGGKTTTGFVAYKYAPLDEIIKQTKELLQKHGLSYTIKTKTTETGIEATCIAKHISGYAEPNTVEMPFGTKTNIMSEPQKVAATLTFAKRYAFCNAFGIVTGDEDNDAVQENVVAQPVASTRTAPTPPAQPAKPAGSFHFEPVDPAFEAIPHATGGGAQVPPPPVTRTAVAPRTAPTRPMNGMAIKLHAWPDATGVAGEKRCTACGWYFTGYGDKDYDCFCHKSHPQTTKVINNPSVPFNS